MNEVLVFLLTLIPVSIGGFLGYRHGFGRLAFLGGSVAVAWGVGLLVVTTGLTRGWFQPFGLLTPIALGGLGASAAWLAVRRLVAAVKRHRSRRDGAPGRPVMTGSRLHRLTGAALGGACGLFIGAGVWLLLFLVDGLAAPGRSAAPAARSPPRETTWTRSLFRTANRGFVRHLPLVGSLSDEVEAMVIIVNSDARVRAKLARRHGLERLAELPSFHAIIDDRGVLQEMDSVGQGDLSALYGLQRNPLIVAFFKEPAVQKTMADLRPSILAREIEAMEAVREGKR